jgi:hypothetical protein
VKGLGEYLTSTEDDTRLKGELDHVAKLMDRPDLSFQSDKSNPAFQDQQAD